MNRRTYRLWLTAIALLGCVLRLLFLTAGSVWLDEVYTMERSRASLGEMFRPSSYDANPPFPYVVYKGWVALFGGSEWSYELPAVLAGVGTIVATGLLGRRLFDEKTGLIGALLVSLSVAHVDASQQIRGYSFGVLLSVLAAHSLCVLLDRRSRTAGAALVATAIMLIYTHYAAVFVVAAILLFGLVHAWRRERKALRAVVYACLAIGLGLAVRLFDVWIQYTDFASFQWIPSPSLGQVREVVEMFNSSSWGYLGLALGIVATSFCFDRGRLVSGERSLLLCWLFFPVVAVLALSLVGRPFFVYRYFVFSVPAYALILAGSCTALPRATLRAAAVAAFSLASVLPLRDYYVERLATQGREEAAEFVAERFQEGDVILHTAFVEFLPTWIFYHHRRFPEYLMAEAAWDELSPFWPERGIVQPSSIVDRYARVWMICDSKTKVTQGHGVFPGHHLDFYRPCGRSTVFLFQRCSPATCDGSRPPRPFPDTE